MSLVSDALAVHAAAHAAAAGEPITYTRGDFTISIDLAVRCSPSRFEANTDFESDVQSNALGWLVFAADLVFDETTEEPLRGDRITTSNGDIFEVAPSQNGEHWRWSDEHEIRYRIHTIKL